MEFRRAWLYREILKVEMQDEEIIPYHLTPEGDKLLRTRRLAVFCPLLPRERDGVKMLRPPDPAS